MGRPKGSKNKPRLHLVNEQVEVSKKATGAQRMALLKRQVVLMVADQMPPEKIAAVLGFEVEKLKAVFAHELEHGREIVRAEILLRFDAAGGEGNIPANRSLESITAAVAPSGDGQEPGKKGGARGAGKFAPGLRPPGIGKKEWAANQAVDPHAGTGWEDIMNKGETRN